ncbi:ABC transporter permease [Microbacterium trichothecenolyticum]|uniref:ABC transport system permease protein n=1 Tax=Microbacterium trichothecenolyticum TaxID=69370 RepID=A0ABU0TYK6_MICTR|nr:ABC transporter permease [Microbacterium trichothecenolyticum]MDQ1124733.1 putative ABC transport system permease protein [Microbacterium trichothecenolyticum]
MYVAWRDLRFARGRFALIGAVVALITLLVGFLSGLTGGLAAQNVSAVLALPGDTLVLQPVGGATATFADSRIDDATVAAWRSADGVRAVTPVGIAQTRAEGPGSGGGVALFGADTASAPPRDDEVTLSAGAATALGAAAGDDVTIAGSRYRVAGVGGDAWYSHTPVVSMTASAWAGIDRRLGGAGLPTVLAVSGDADWSAVATETGTTASTPLSSLTALPTFRSEIGSLALMIAMLFAVSALVVGAFFTVWTMQRAGDVAVLKALGASTPALLRDALGQALVVLAAGVGVGIALTAGLGALADGALPFVLSPLTTLAPALVMIALGVLGAAVSLRIVTASDPLTALGSTR